LIDLRRTDWPAALYRGEISYLDMELGRLLDHPRVQNGLVAFTADHGEELNGSLSRFDHRSLTPSTLHVPLLLAGPQVPNNTRVEIPVDQLDIGRTMLDLSGLYAADFPGRNLLRHLDEDSNAERHLHFAMSAHGFSASVTSVGWHLILQLRAQRIPFKGQVPRWDVSLHDLSKDELCATNLRDQEPDQTKKLLGKLMQWLREKDHEPVVTTRNTSASEIAELSALGYSTGVESVESTQPWLPADLTALDILDQQK
jgi:arylsulfatase A-like enzyme